MARKKKKQLSKEDISDLRIIRLRKKQHSRPYEEFARENGLPINDLEDYLL